MRWALVERSKVFDTNIGLVLYQCRRVCRTVENVARIQQLLACGPISVKDVTEELVDRRRSPKPAES